MASKTWPTEGGAPSASKNDVASKVKTLRGELSETNVEAEYIETVETRDRARRGEIVDRILKYNTENLQAT